MKKSRNFLSTFGAVSLVATSLCVACAGASGPGGDESGSGVGPASPESVAEAPRALSTLPSDSQPNPYDGSTADDASDKAGYVYIQYCDYPNSWVGTRCIWSNGSSFCAAVAECVRDTRSVCGSATATWTIYTNQGDLDMNYWRSYCGV